MQKNKPKVFMSMNPIIYWGGIKVQFTLEMELYNSIRQYKNKIPLKCVQGQISQA